MKKERDMLVAAFGKGFRGSVVREKSRLGKWVYRWACRGKGCGDRSGVAATKEEAIKSLRHGLSQWRDHQPGE